MKFRSSITGKFVSLAVARRWGYPSEAQRRARLANIKKAQAANRKRKRKPPKKRPRPEVTPRAEREVGAPPAPAPEFVEGEITEISPFGIQFFDDAAGDDFEEWDDVDYFSFDESDEFIDEESDDYEEDT